MKTMKQAKLVKAVEPCVEGWESTEPGAGNFKPDPCVRCGWSREDHSKLEARRDTANEVLIAINETLAIHGLSAVRTQNRRGDEFAYTVIALPTRKRM